MVMRPKRKKSVQKTGGRRRQREVKRRPQAPRIKRLLVVRHSERLDKLFPDLLRRRRYTRTDSNQPSHLPIHGRKFREYQADPPLTLNGRHLARQLHESLEEAGIVLSVVLCSPALRCVETACFLVQDGQRVRIEPSLHENWVTQPGVEPNNAYLTPAQYLAVGFAVDTDYVPIQRQIAVNREHPRAYFRQFGHSIDALIARMDREHPGGTVTLVGHSSTLDAVHGHLIGGSMEAYDDQGDYIGVFEREPVYTQAMVLDRTRNGGWQLKEGALKGYTTTGFTTVNVLRDEEEGVEDGEQEEEDEEED